MNEDPLAAHIKSMGDNYKSYIEKWQKIKEELLKDVKEAEDKIQENEKGLEVLQEQKRKLRIE